MGPYLGEFTNEIDTKNGTHIVEVVCLGPKVYSYKTNADYVSLACKGFTLNFTVDKLINFETLKNIVCNNREIQITVESELFKRNKHLWNIETITSIKTLSFVYDKRKIVDFIYTLPYGHI